MASLAALAAASMVLVAVAVQIPSRDDGSDSPSGGFVPRSTAARAGAAARPTFAAQTQGLGLADIQDRIRATDEEWKVIGPKLRKVMAVYAAAEAGLDGWDAGGADDSGFAPRGRGGPGGPGGGPPGGPGNDSFAGPGDSGPFGRGGPGPGGFGRGGPRPEGFGPGGPAPDGFGPGDPGPDGFGPSGPDPGGFGRGGRGPGGFGPGGPGPGGGPPGFGGAVMQRLVELRTALADPNTTFEQFKEKTAAVRNAREKAKAELAAARKDLLELLTLDQEAMLVSLGYLD